MHKKLDKKNVENIYELTELQKSIFYDCMRFDDPSMYVIQNIFEVNGPFDKTRFLESMESLVGKHTVLRSVIRWEHMENPVSVIIRPDVMKYVNWTESECDEKELEHQAKEYSNKLMQEGIKLDADCLIQFDVIHTNSKSILFIQYHHIILDGWSFAIFIKEFLECYRKNEMNGSQINYYIAYKELPVYEDEALEYWKNKTQNSLNKFVLPIGDDRTFENLSRNVIRKRIESDTTKRIKQFCLSQNISLSLYMYVAWSIFLSRYSGQEDVSFGVVLSGRDAALNNILDTIGLFSNTVIWSENLTDLRVRDVFDKAVEQYTDIQKYQYTPVHVVNALTDNRNGMEAPETLLVFENYPLPEDTGFDIKYIETRENNSFPIIINIFDGDEIKLEFDYICEKYTELDLKRVSNYFCALLEHMTGELELPVNELEILTSEDVKQQLEEFNPGKREYPRNTSVAELIINIAEASPSAKALYHVETEESMTYSELNIVSNDIANTLLEKGVKRGDIVCIVLDNCIEFVPCMLGIMRCGAAFLPVDNKLPMDRVKQILEDVSPKAMLTKTQNGWDDESSFSTILYVDKIVHSDNIVKDFALEQDTAYLIATSGTTGKSKYVEISNRSFTDFVTWTIEEYQYKEQTRSLLSLSFAFDSAILQVYPTLVSGSELFLIDPNRRREPDYYLNVLSKYEIVIIDEIPTVLNLMFQKIQHDNLYKGECLLPSLRCISLGSEYVPIDVARGCRKYLNDKAHIINAYGPAETTVVVSTYEFDGRNTEEKSLIGKPRENTQFVICNDAGKLCPIGVPGEICISGECVAKGYYNNPTETTKKFIENPYAIGEEYKILYRTGDKGRWLDSGNIEFLGRIDNQVKYHGYRLEVEGIETQIQKVLGEINVAVAIIQQGENDYLTAFIETTQDIQINVLRNEVKKCLPVYAIPSRFICVESLPYNSNGKVDRKRLAQFVGHEEVHDDNNVSADQQTSEIRKLWVSVLGHNNFSNSDNFFEIGGNSISIVKLHMKLSELYPDVEIVMGDMFTYSTVNQMNDYIKSLKSGDVSDDVNEASIDKTDYINDDIAIVGIAGYLPKATNIDVFWDNLLNGVDCVQEISEERKKLDLCFHENKTYLKWGYIEDIDKFDPLFFRISPKIGQYMDPNHRLMLRTAYLALEDGGYYKAENKDYVTGVYLGAILPNYVKYVKDIAIDEILASNLPANMAGRISYHLGLTGPSMLIDTACSSSLVCLHYAVNAIRNKECDMAVLGSTYIELEHLDKDVAHTSGIVSENEKCCSFSDHATGTIGGEGCIAVVVKRKEQAIKDNDNIYAVIKGSSVNNNGDKSNGLTAPNSEIQAECIQRAWKNAKIDPNTISYIETHGSATKLGDPIEMRGIQLAYQSVKETRDEKIPIGCVKTNIGHLDSVSGLAGLLKVILCMKHNMLVPSLNYEKPNPFIDFDNMPVYVQTDKKPWVDKNPLRAGVSSFGLSGTNCHLVVEQAPSRTEHTEVEKPYYICVFSGRSLDVLRKQIEIISNLIKSNKEIHIRDLSYTLATRKRQKYMKAFVVEDLKSLHESLDTWLKNTTSENEIISNKALELNNIRVFFGELSENDKIPSCYFKMEHKINSEKREFHELNIEKYIALTKILVDTGFGEKNFENDPFAQLIYKIVREPNETDKFLEEFSQNKKQLYKEQVGTSTVLFGENETLKCNKVIHSIGNKELWNYLADLIVDNSDINVESIMHGKTIHLSNSPFEEQSYWIPNQSSTETSITKIDYTKEVEELKENKIIQEVIWQIVDTSILKDKQDLETVIIFISKDNSCNNLISKFKDGVDNVIVVDLCDRFDEISESEIKINYKDINHFVKLYSLLLERYSKIDCSFVCLPGDCAFDNKKIEQVEKELSDTIALMNNLCNAQMKIAGEETWKLCLVTSGAYHVDDSDHVIDPLLSIPVSLHRTINSEITNITSKIIDIDDDVFEHSDVVDLVKRILSSELVEVALRRDMMYQQMIKLQDLNIPKYGKCNFVDNGVYLVTGGLGSLSLKIINHLSNDVKANFILIGRSSTKDPEKLDLLKKIEENDCNVDIQIADISDETHWKELLEYISDKYGHINGVIHTAGIIGNKKAFLDTKWEDYYKMFQAKVFGTIVMDRILRRFNPEFTIMFSSIDAYCSMLKNAPYASANYFMQAFAKHYQQLGRNIMVVSWGGWRFEGMKDSSTTEEGYENIHDYGIVTAIKTGFDLEIGLKAFDVIIKLNISNSLVSYIDNNDLNSLRSKGFTVMDIQTEGMNEQIDLSKEKVMQDILQAWETALKISPIALDDNFFECGGDSIVSVEIMFRIQEIYKISLSVDIIFEYDTVEKLTEHVWEQLCDGE